MSEFDKLKDYIQNRMKMSHIYQPIMLIEVLTNNGMASVKQIAKSFLARDESQIDYFIDITKKMPGDRLTHHNIVKKQGKANKIEYYLENFSELTQSEINELVEICYNKFNSFVEGRPELWQYRTKAQGYIKGRIRTQVFKRAKSRCEACGISSEKRYLDIDHIIPRSKGGSDDINNLQALCFVCNRNKGNTDDTNFHKVIKSYNDRQEGCLFCELPKDRVIAENNLAYAVYDGYPVTEYHILIIPKRHTPTYFDLYQPEVNACNQLLQDMKARVEEKDKTVTGFNIGMNNGKDAGQTIFHCHIHLIPRRQGDVDTPKGGVRGVIPSKQGY